MRWSILMLMLQIGICAQEAHAPIIERAPLESVHFEGPLRQHLDALTEQWLLTMPERNPGMLAMLSGPGATPDLLPWSGEFAGKYLTGAVQVYRLNRDVRLRQQLQRFVATLGSLQRPSGYLGPFSEASLTTGRAANCKDGTWDGWGHYHLMLGLLLWHDETGDAAALDCAAKIGDLLCREFLFAGKHVLQAGNAEKNHAIAHGLCLLYRQRKELRYLEQARSIIEEFREPGAGDYIRIATSGKEFHQSPQPRWESLHPLLALPELYWQTGNAGFRTAFEALWWSIAKLDRHNNGGFSTDEQAHGDPYRSGAIETCATVAWMAMSVEMLRLTGNSVIADELELSTLNSVYGYQSRDGKWVTYNTPMDGKRVPSMQDVAFQIRPGTEEVNCCSANGPRGFGLLSEWALMRKGDDGVVVNWYGPSTMTTRLGTLALTLNQVTNYPGDGRVELQISPSRAAQFTIFLRIPQWSSATRIAVNGKEITDPVEAGRYLAITRTWTKGDQISLMLDMSIRHWAGAGDLADKASLYWGPLLLALNAPMRASTTFDPEWKRYGDLQATDQRGSSVVFEFTGTGITWRGYRFDDAGIATVFLNGREIAAIDQYDATRGTPFSWKTSGLTSGKHRLVITVSGSRNQASRGGFINVTALEPTAWRDEVGSLNLAQLTSRRLDDADGSSYTVQVTDADGRSLMLRDFASSGASGLHYWSWIYVVGAKKSDFSPMNLLRTSR